MSPDEFIAALTDHERAQIDDARRSGDARANATIHAILESSVRRTGAGEEALYAAFFRLKIEKPADAASEAFEIEELARLLPYPLGWKLTTVLRDARRFDDGEPAPQLAFDLFALVSLLLRTTAIVLTQAYVWTGATDARLNRIIVEALASPLVDEAWLDLGRAMARGLATRKDAPAIAAELGRALEGRTIATGRHAVGITATDTKDLSYLIALRNHVAHGNRVAPESIRAAVETAKDVLARFGPLARQRLVVRTGAGGFTLEGEIPTPISALDPSLPENEPCLIRRDGEGPPLSLSPLMCFRSLTGAFAVDELFFLNAGTIEHLSYVGFKVPLALDGTMLGSNEAFAEWIKGIPTPPIPEDPRLDFTQLAAEATTFFVGRDLVLDDIERIVRERDRHPPFAIVRAVPGMGKTSLLARLHQRHPPRRAGEIGPGDRWCFHFCGSADGRDSPVVALRSLMGQLADAANLDSRERSSLKSSDLRELRDGLFPALLADVASRLTPEERVVIVIDALDEGFGAGDPIASVLPAVLPANAIALLSWRVDQSGKNARVDDAIRHIDLTARREVVGADPLKGLARPDVRDFIAHVRRALAGANREASLADFAPPDQVLEAVWRAGLASGGDADPFYLRFIAHGAETGGIDLARAESIPDSLDDAFEDAWLALPADRDFAVHRLLVTLAVLREPGTDTLLAELLTRATSEKLRPDEIASLRVQAGKLLVYDRDRYSLFHDRFRRFLVGDQKDLLDVPPSAQS